MITITPHALDAIGLFLVQKGISGGIRIQLQSTGCCDASLGLMIDDPKDTDMKEDIEDVIFIISPELYDLTGDIIISYSTDGYMPGFVVISENPVSEWAGFGVCQIKC